MNNILFVDFDGVLTNANSFDRSKGGRSGLQAVADPACVRALNRVLRETEAAIVVSSTWRLYGGLPFVRGKLREWRVSGEVVGITPSPLRGDSPWLMRERGEEIAEWLRAHDPQGVLNFAIIDDDERGIFETPLEVRFVQTRFDPGLTERDADRAISILTNTREEITTCRG